MIVWGHEDGQLSGDGMDLGVLDVISHVGKRNSSKGMSYVIQGETITVTTGAMPSLVLHVSGSSRPRDNDNLV